MILIDFFADDHWITRSFRLHGPDPDTAVFTAHHQVGGHVAVTRDQAADVRHAGLPVTP